MEGKAFEENSTSVAATEMHNALDNLAETVKDPNEKKVSSSTSELHHPRITELSD